ncbi:hypothetical protein SAMN02910275_01630 [Butyrivibrio sp. INlla18]|uniref:hypothetical protein n=1 Tax=Butyrivibrio sp. INlla18 TaxID=1520806 RepID=UPI0008858CDB|nr:hypothetical protein [Butyrivibrio sp. INlla18]SDA61903.1 hypothetical protein SAMN02910275_01630 [Butyrivibrio sp. INlla18]
MKIAQANVNMVSTNRYYEENSVTVQTGMVTKGSFLENLNDQEKKMDSLELSKTSDENEAVSSQSYSSLKPSKTEQISRIGSTLEDQLAEIRSTLLSRILQLLELLGGENQSKYYQKALGDVSGLLENNSYLSVTTIENVHIEEEQTTFSGQGLALTEDGRTIDFNVEFSLSRRLCEYAGISVATAGHFLDPLVINVGSDVTSISDQSFYFDLDSDGQEEKISNLGAGSGFLALDKNGDGKINNGLELFGTKSGNGFKDLAMYDKDGNGWIDENDEVYEHLRVWLRDEDGTDRLLSLSEADVGAIYLGSAETEFTQYNSSFAVAGMLRASGMFLKESGGVGTLQQVDMAAM